MNNYFVPNTRLRGKDLTNVIYGDLDLDGLKGKFFDEEAYQSIKSQLSKHSLAPSSIEGVFRITALTKATKKVKAIKLGKNFLIPSNSTNTITIEDWQGPYHNSITHKERQEVFTKVIEENLMPFRAEDVRLSVPYNSYRDPKHNDCIHIFVFAAAGNTYATNSFTMPKRIFDVPVESFSALKCGQKLDDTLYIKDGDYQVASVIGKNLFIHHDLCCNGSVNECLIFEKILERFLDIIGRGTRKKLTKKELRSQVLAGYTEALNTIPHQILKKTTTELSSKTSEASSYKSEYESYLAQYLEAKRKVQALSLEKCEYKRILATPLPKAELEKQVDEFIKVPGIDSIQFLRQTFVINTKPINLMYQDKLYSIGKFIIRVSLDDGRIVFKNISKQGKGTDYNIIHPYINEKGYIYPGASINAILPSLIGKLEIKAMLSIIMQFLVSADRKIKSSKSISKSWPLAKKPRAKTTKKEIK